MRCRLYPPVSLFVVSKERYNLCMNRASVDHESLDRVSWTSKTRGYGIKKTLYLLPCETEVYLYEDVLGKYN